MLLKLVVGNFYWTSAPIHAAQAGVGNFYWTSAIINAAQAGCGEPLLD